MPHANSGAASISDARRGSLRKGLCTKRAKQTPLASDRGMTALALSHERLRGAAKAEMQQQVFTFYTAY